MSLLATRGKPRPAGYVRMISDGSGQRLLLIGPRTTPLVGPLQAAGYQVTEVPVARPSDAPASPRLPDTGGPGEAAPETLLVLDHPESEPLLDLLLWAGARLPVGGRLLVRFAEARQDNIEPDSTPGCAERVDGPGATQALACLQGPRDAQLAMAARCGFAEIATQAAVAPEVIGALGAGVAATIAWERGGSQPRWRLSVLRSEDTPAFSALFERTFGAAMPPALVDWKYGGGRGRGVGAWRDGRLVGHYGCTRRTVLCRGRPLVAAQICDVMVERGERAVMTKDGVMFRTAATLLELELALGAAGLAYGFPNARAERLGERLGLYREVGRMLEVRWPARAAHPRLGSQVRALDTLGEAAARRAVSRLWSAMREALREAILVARDWDYLRYRYLDHPVHHYQVFLVSRRLTRAPLGLLVLRRHERHAELLDLIAPPRRIPLLIAQARRIAAGWGADSLFCWITRQHVGRFRGGRAAEGARVSDLGISVPTNVWVPGIPPEQLQDAWWLMSGDTEFH